MSEKPINEGAGPTGSEPNGAEELAQKIAKLEEEKNNLVGELKSDRKARQELKEQIEILKEQLEETLKSSTQQPAQNPGEVDVKQVVEQTLAEREASKAKLNKKIAFEKFVTQNKEFHPDNDPGGLKRAALEEKLSRFNTDGIVEIEDFMRVIEDAKALLGRTDTTPQASTEQPIQNPYSSTPKVSVTPQHVENSGLTDKEKRLIEQHGFTEERYLRLKEKMPDYIDNLLKYVK